MRKTDAAGIKFLKDAEGVKLRAYKDSGGVWTIGVGHIAGVKRGQVITEEEAEEFLAEDLEDAEAGVDDAVTAALNQNQFNALVSLAFNIGVSAFARSTLVRKLNAGDNQGAADQFLRWNKDNGATVPGLTNRRRKERALFLKAAPVLNGEVTKPAPEAVPGEITTEKIVTTTVDKPGSTVVEKISSSVSTLAGNEQIKTIASEGVGKLATKAVASMSAAGAGATAGAATASNPWPWIILAIVCLLLAAGVVFLWMKHKSNKETKTAEINSDKDRADIKFVKS